MTDFGNYIFPIAKWDPSWGWDNQIYYLGSPCKNFKEFFNWPCALYLNGEIVFRPKKAQLCAGSFIDNLYFGSLSYDIYDEKNNCYMDQSLFVCNRDWEILTEFRPSNFIKKRSNLFSLLNVTDRMVIPFRDPALLPNGNLSICTAGYRWGNLPGNICEVKYEDSKFILIRETIIENDMRNFYEIERATYWNEYMFFSVSVPKGSASKGIQIAKLNKNGLYSYYGEVENSYGLYGPDVNEDLMMLFWYKLFYQINNPKNKNLFYSSGQWSLI